MNDRFDELRQQYGCGPVQFSGADEALYNRHLLFDDVIDPFKATPREQFEAMARSLRDVISQRWLLTEKTYAQKNPKRVYYLSMEFLLGRSLMNNAINAQLRRSCSSRRKASVDPALIETEPDAGLGNGGLGRLAACFLDSMATLALPGMGYGLRYEYGIFKQTIQDGWQVEQPDNWLRRPDPWEVARLGEAVEVKLNCSFELQAGALHPIVGRPSVLLGIPFDRPVIGYGGKTINTLRLWAAATPDYFDFQRFSRATSWARWPRRWPRVLDAGALSDDSTSMGQGLRFLQEYFLVACSLPIWCGVPPQPCGLGALPEKAAIQLNDTHPAMAFRAMRILLDEAQLGWDQAWDLTQRTLAYQPYAIAEAWSGRSSGSRCCCRATGRSSRRSIAACSTRSAPLPWRRGSAGSRERDRRGAQASAHGEPGDRRLAQHQWGGRYPFATAARATVRIWRSCSRSASTTRPTA
jgi:starch phosphorylase